MRAEHETYTRTHAAGALGEQPAAPGGRVDSLIASDYFSSVASSKFGIQMTWHERPSESNRLLREATPYGSGHALPGHLRRLFAQRHYALRRQDQCIPLQRRHMHWAQRHRYRCECHIFAGALAGRRADQLNGYPQLRLAGEAITVPLET